MIVVKTVNPTRPNVPIKIDTFTDVSTGVQYFLKENSDDGFFCEAEAEFQIFIN